MPKERRLYKRHILNFPVIVRLEREPDRAFAAEARTISPKSMDLECGSELLDVMRAAESHPYSCDITFQPPASEGYFFVHCQLINFRRLSQHRYRLALQLASFQQDGEERFSHYLMQLATGEISPPTPGALDPASRQAR